VIKVSAVVARLAIFEFFELPIEVGEIIKAGFLGDKAYTRMLFVLEK
jgi:hypothetical protein